MKLLLEIITSIFTIIPVFLMGIKWKYAPLFGVFCQFIWIWYILYTHAWGLSIVTGVLLVVYIRNSYLWLRKKGTK